jgi:ribosomal protein L35AE/L33A
VSTKQAKILDAIFADPVRADILWRDIVALFKAKGARVRQGAGSRIRVTLGDVRATFHEPHPGKTTDKGAVRSVRHFLESAGVRP